MKYSLRSLVVAVLVLPPLLALVIVAVQKELKKREEQAEINRWLERYTEKPEFQSSRTSCVSVSGLKGCPTRSRT